MVPQSIAYLGRLRCLAVHGPSNVELITDAPADNQGRGESFSPTDLIVTAYATCIMTTIGIVAEREGVLLDGTSIHAEKHMSTEGPRRIARIVLQFDVPPGIPAEFRLKLENTARACPVARSLHPDIELEVRFGYREA